MILSNIFRRAEPVTENAYGNFNPSEYGTIVFMGLFFLATILIIYQIISHRKKALNPVVVAILFLGAPILELVGLCVRLPSVRNPSNLGLYIANMIILDLGPLYLVIINWLTFPALIYHASPRYSMLRPRVIVGWTFGFLIICTDLQVRGVAQSYNHTEDIGSLRAGQGLMLGGLGLTLGAWIIYTILFAIFASRYFGEHSIKTGSRIRSIFLVLSINIITILIRTVYRIVEFSILARSEVQLDDIWFYIWDSTPTFIAVMAFAIVLPYDLPYGGMFKRFRKRKCGRTDAAVEIQNVSEVELTKTNLEHESRNP